MVIKFLSLSLSLLGIVFGLRIMSTANFRELFVFKQHEELKRWYICVLAALSLIAMTIYGAIGVCLLHIAQLFALYIIRIVMIQNRQKAFRQGISGFLDTVALFMQAGHSFRDSIQDSLHSQPHFFKLRMSELMEVVVFSQQEQSYSHAFLKEVVDEFRRIDTTPHSAVVRLQAYRKKLKTIESFRRKSGQILMQSRIQSVVMVLMYLAVLCFMALTSGFADSVRLVGASILLFSLGTFWAFQIGRRMKWKL